jgi:putative transposase
MEVNEIYFFTATINRWMHLLKPDNTKFIIISALEYLTRHNKADVFAFVIMPSHIHFIWRATSLNGKEHPKGSFLKYTAHEFKKLLSFDPVIPLSSFKIDAHNKAYEFWQKDPLAIILYTRKVAFQKLDYIHFNPCTGKWKLVKDPCDYYFSSAAFYEKGINHFSFLKDIRDEF